MNSSINIYSTFERVTTQQFKSFILPLKNKLYRFALSFVVNEADAKDVVQDVMIKSWERIEDISKIKNIEAWCMTMTRNKSLDMLRKKGRNHLQIADQVHLSSTELNPFEKTSTLESRSNIQHFIAQLPDNQREVITLRDIEGHSYKEIADILNLELNHVKVLLHRARQSVKKKLEKIYQR